MFSLEPEDEAYIAALTGISLDNLIKQISNSSEEDLRKFFSNTPPAVRDSIMELMAEHSKTETIDTDKFRSIMSRSHMYDYPAIASNRLPQSRDLKSFSMKKENKMNPINTM